MLTTGRAFGNVYTPVMMPAIMNKYAANPCREHMQCESGRHSDQTRFSPRHAAYTASHLRKAVALLA